MSLGDLVAAADLPLFAVIGLFVAATAFAVVATTLLLGRNREPFERARLMPLEDDDHA